MKDLRYGERLLLIVVVLGAIAWTAAMLIREKAGSIGERNSTSPDDLHVDKL